ncbi:hypothetical protein Y1Q_0001321 [Alligator mississippiensis]|uniref:Uncharacterized protein n=1 Tax=Alligator mississippiensis TaxID=8496 RepID=A0A151M924_ALLMI|nr:hypothetical protein Y1Q_0001321 [Alligator mississippiensis]
MQLSRGVCSVEYGLNKSGTLPECSYHRYFFHPDSDAFPGAKNRARQLRVGEARCVSLEASLELGPLSKDTFELYTALWTKHAPHPIPLLLQKWR